MDDCYNTAQAMGRAVPIAERENDRSIDPFSSSSSSSMKRLHHGFLGVDKPTGVTSAHVVDHIKRMMHRTGSKGKVGHGGTLDPLATGVLPVAVGVATRLLRFLPTRKEYMTTVRFGLQTTSDDADGEITRICDASALRKQNLEEALADFVGEIDQVPPIVSAVHYKGERAYILARQKKDVHLAPRRVMVHKIHLIDWRTRSSGGSPHPEAVIRVSCEAGFYVRALARDLALRLGTVGAVWTLRRTLSCAIATKDAVACDEDVECCLDLPDALARLSARSLELIPSDKLLQHIPAVVLNPEDLCKWKTGSLRSLPDRALMHRFLTNADNKDVFVRIYQANHPPVFHGVAGVQHNGLTATVVVGG